MTAKCSIIVDSTCDFTKAQVDAANLVCLPFTYTEANKDGGGFHGNDDLFQSISAHDFYEMIRRGATPMTSQPSQAVYEQAFRDALDRGLPTICVCITSGLSGAYSGATVALDRLKEELGRDDLPIYIIDSHITSTPLTLLVDELVRQRDAGRAAEELVEWVNEASFHTHTTFLVDNLDTLHRGGRVPKAATVAVNLLDAKPQLTFALDGTLTFLAVSRGRKKAMKRMADYYKKHHDDSLYGPVVAIGDADCPADGDALADKLRREYPGLRVLRSTIGPTIGCHVGPGMLSCCFWGADRRGARYEKVGHERIKGINQG
jgi:DegV family protein with EDD domain